MFVLELGRKFGKKKLMSPPDFDMLCEYFSYALQMTVRQSATFAMDVLLERCPPETPIPVSQTCQMLDMPLEEPVLLVLSATLRLSPVVEGVAWATLLERVVQLWALAEGAI